MAHTASRFWLCFVSLKLQPAVSRGCVLLGASYHMHHRGQLSNLPSEILEVIVCFIPLIPRIRVVSRVSQRWRFAVLRSVTNVSKLRISNEFATALPCVRAVTLSSVTPSALLHSLSTVTDLRIAPDATANHSTLFQQVSTLTRLSLMVYEKDAWVVALACHNAAHLVSLSLACVNGALTPAVGIMRLSYPSLTTLKLQAGLLSDLSKESESFLTRHATQLHSLTTFYGFVPASILVRIRNGDFSRLRKLAISCEVSDDPVFLCMITSLQTSVTEIDLDLSSASSHALAVICATGTRLRRLSLAGDDITPESLSDSLRSCTRLYSVTMSRSLCLGAAAAGCPIGKVFDCQITANDLWMLTSLRSAYLSTPFKSEGQIPPLLPNLRSLYMHLEQTSLLIPFVYRLLQAAPRLDFLDVHLADQWRQGYEGTLDNTCSLLSGKVSMIVFHVNAEPTLLTTQVQTRLRRDRWLHVIVEPSKTN